MAARSAAIAGTVNANSEAGAPSIPWMRMICFLPNLSSRLYNQQKLSEL